MKLVLLLGAYLLGVACVHGQQFHVPTTEVHACHRRAFGFARDLTNCQQYFVCQNGNPVRARCPGNLAFDAHNQVCWWREEVTCFNCPQTALYSLQPVPHTCHQFYRCWRGRATIHTCPNDLVFHPRQRRCTRLSGSGCAGDDVIPEGCPAQNGPNPVYLIHASDCNAYFVCENGRPREVRCEEGLHFNPDLRVCDVPAKANCQAQSNPPWDPNPGGEDGGWDINGNQSPLPCPESGNGFLPHRDNCNAFFACSSNQQTPLNCAPGLHFDHERQLCDLPRKSRCWFNENPPIPGQNPGGPGGPGGPGLPPGGPGPVFPPWGMKPGMGVGMVGQQLPPGMLPPGGIGPQLPLHMLPQRPRAASLTDGEDENVSEIALEQ